VNGYGLLGIGAYNRYVAMTQTALGYGYVCDPWWGFCYPALVAGDLIVADTSQTKFGWNVGVGLEFPIRYSGAWFVEARYHRIEGTNATEYVPIQIGYRF
jgi:opacity protein-like surface antigen